MVDTRELREAAEREMRRGLLEPKNVTVGARCLLALLDALTAAEARAAQAEAMQEAVMVLLYSDEVFVGTHWEGPWLDKDTPTWPALCVHYPAYGADAEEVPPDQIIPLANLVREFGSDAATAWACHRRGRSDPDKGKLTERGRAALARIRALPDLPEAQAGQDGGREP